MSNLTKLHNDYAKYVYLHIDPSDLFRPDEKEQSGITIHVKMDDEGIVVDAWSREDEVIASAWKTYSEMGVGVVAVDTLEELKDKASKWDNYIKSIIEHTGG
jgi:hypothetical protein